MASKFFIKPTIQLIHKIIRLNDSEFIDWYIHIVDSKKGIISLDKFLIAHCHKLDEQLENIENISISLNLFKNKHIQPKYLLHFRQKTVIYIKRELVYELTCKYL
jgi:hypothetical protein